MVSQIALLSSGSLGLARRVKSSISVFMVFEKIDDGFFSWMIEYDFAIIETTAK